MVSISSTTAGATRASRVSGANRRAAASPSSDSIHSTNTCGGTAGGMSTGPRGGSAATQLVRKVTTSVIGVAPLRTPLDGVTLQIVVGGFPVQANVTGPLELG